MHALAASQARQTEVAGPGKTRRIETRERMRLSADSARITSIQTYVAERRERDAQAAFAESVTRRLATRNTGREDGATAFTPDKLRRVRAFLGFANEAKALVLRSAARPA